MSTSVPSPTGAHLVGSVPLADAAEVFTVAAGELGPTCAGSPTARPGAGRSGSPGRATSSPATPTSRSTPRPRGSMRRWTASGFATGWTPAACASSDWATRTPPSPPTRLRAAPARGRDPRPHPLPGQPPDAGGAGHPVRLAAWQALVEPAFEEALLRELDEIVAAIPHDQLAVQWDVAIEMGFWEGVGGLFTAAASPVLKYRTRPRTRSPPGA